ncbi:glycosyltransferase [Asticcacaulis sp.]|uniref:glycosyltransferase n=1 Tax=Asticcacaulis sp. TaxID=1872648 RepID=UPI00260594A2|nr:glycosyltransferase [Asticcacaulis sp.]
MLGQFIQWLDQKIFLRKSSRQPLPWSMGNAETEKRAQWLRAGNATALAGDLVTTLKWAQKMGAREGLKLLFDLRALRHSNFDSDFYLRQNPFDSSEPEDPIRHFAMHGVKNQLDPEPFFDTAFYLAAHADVAQAGINPYVHFLSHGYIEGRRFEPSNFGSGRPEGFLRVDDWRTVNWPRRDGATREGGHLAYDQRPDDAVIDEIRAAKEFAAATRIFESQPDMDAAVRILNQMDRDLSAPVVSIVIPVYGQVAYTLNCLHALLSHRSRYAFEIIVGDDASPDSTEAILCSIKGIRYVRHRVNVGFLHNCNITVGEARGDYVVLLNNDTRVVSGWLDALIEGLETLPNAGLVGSKIYFPDASLQEAGGIVWKDGSAWNYGRNDDPNRPRYSHARRVDYVSGCSIALRRDIWESLGGFDPLFAPAYYEDTDMAFRIRERGQQVWMTPLSRVIHYEGVTSGTDTGVGVKAYQVENQKKFLERWAPVLAGHRENGVEPWLERNRPLKKVVLMLDSVTPTPDQDAGSAATVALMKAYLSLGYHVIFLPEDNFLYDGDRTAALQAMGVECLYAPYESSMGEILGRFAPYISVLQLIRPAPAGRALSILQTQNIDARVLYLNADLHYLRLERQSIVENNPELLADAVYMKRLEMDIVQGVDGTFVHSSVEKDLLIDYDPSVRVSVLPLVSAIAGASAPAYARSDIVFIGSFGHPPNLDAALWMIRHIWPGIAAACPGARLVIIGNNPPEELKALQSERVVIAGYVKDLTARLEQARVFVAPLRYGAGAKGKIVTAMAHGLPVVGTPVAIEGMPSDIKAFGREADSAATIAKAVIELYGLDDMAWRELSDAAIRLVGEYHSAEAMARVLSNMLEQICTEAAESQDFADASLENAPNTLLPSG